MPRPAPLDAYEAAALVERMKRETTKPARVRLMQVALRIGNLTDGAKAVYRDALREDGAKA